MDRYEAFLRVTNTPDLWYNFDTKETIANDELKTRVTKGILSDDEVSNVPDVFPLFGDLDMMVNTWIPYMEMIARGETFPAEIRIAKQGRGISYPVVKGFEQIPAFSRGRAPWKQLSPFTIGPVLWDIVDEDDNEVPQEAESFENFWQGHKVWSKVDKQSKKEWSWPEENHVGNGRDRNPNAAWQKWHQALMKHKQAVRRPNGKAVPLYAWWQGHKLDIIEARKAIYIPYYQSLLREHEVYQALLKKVKKGQNIIIIEPDGPSTEFWPDGMPITLEMAYDLQKVTNVRDLLHVAGADFATEEGRRYVPYGHGYVIALTLFQDMLPVL
ncbi:MAG: hypothetical protein ACMG6E_03165 [Candidatus Roizmanbacteria bacterium]